MKKLSFGTLLLGVFLISCTKETGNSEITNEVVIKKAAGIPGSNSPQYITLSSNGDYTSSYGGGITFSSNFPHPTIVDASGVTDGEPVVGFPFVAFIQPNITFASTIDNARFTLVQPKFPNAVTMTQATDYFNALHKYWDDKTGTELMPSISASMDSNSVIVIKGMVVRDHNSPSNVSVVLDTYQYTVPPILLCGLTKSGYSFKFYGTLSDTGMILKITGVNSSNSPVTITSYSIQYSLINSGNDYQLSGYLKLSDGTQISINDITFSLR